MQISLSSSAITSEAWLPVPMPSRPTISPAMWNAVTWSRPSSSSTRLLKKPLRTAKSAAKSAPARKIASPRFTRFLV